MVERDVGTSPAELEAIDASHVWHPFTHMQRYMQEPPPMIVRGRGVRVQDTNGTWYDDGTSSIWLNVHGHAVPELDDAIRGQLGRIAHSTLLGLANVPSTELAARLVEIVPSGLTRAFYTDNGAGAVEAAIKIAVQYFANRGETRPYILGFSSNYHGDTLGAVGVATDDLFHAPFTALLPDHPRVPYPAAFRSPSPATVAQDSLDAVERVLVERLDVAAVIVEPVQGAAGIVPPPAGFLAGLRDTCTRHGVLLIVDEVATGFARTGPMFACEPEGVSPDIMCLGKGITGGYLPLAATLVGEEIFAEFLGEPSRTFFHGHSYTGNPLGAAVACANLDLLEKLLPELPPKVELIADAIAPLANHPFVSDVRHAGFMVGVELTLDDGVTPFPYDARAGWVVSDAARERGLLIRPIGNTVTFVPMPGAPIEDLERMTANFIASFEDATDALAVTATAGFGSP